MISKWHFKHNQFNVKTAALNFSGQQKNKSSTRKKVSIHHFVVKTVVQKHVQALITMEAEAAEVIEVQDNLSQ